VMARATTKPVDQRTTKTTAVNEASMGRRLRRRGV
jgi:hypothetical protein